MLGFPGRKVTSSKLKEKTDRELLELILSRCDELEGRLEDIEDALGGKEGMQEKKESKQELKEANSFIRTLCLTLVENSKAVNVAAASKPSAVEAYLANKNAAATASTKEIAKPNGPAKLPG